MSPFRGVSKNNTIKRHNATLREHKTVKSLRTYSMWAAQTFSNEVNAH